MEDDMDLDYESRIVSENEEFLEESYNIGEKILLLSDSLAEDIILDSITEQLEGADPDGITSKINYVRLFREKYNSLSPSDEIYDAETVRDIAERVMDTVGEKLYTRYGVRVSNDLDFESIDTCLGDLETLYEFLFIRQFQNLSDYISARLRREKDMFVDKYLAIMDEDPKHGDDIFMIQSKKKFKNNSDVIIMHFLNEIIHDIVDMTQSAYDLFLEIANLDLYEEYNNKMSELLIQYGNKLVIEDDEAACKKYLSLVNDSISFSEVRNAVLLDFLSTCELED
jgi:succinate dehydrogenase flavin-adding protein (antitoxin of CptAB toxin-antitoxin module)